MIAKVKHFFNDTLWEPIGDDFPKWKAVAFQQMRLLFLAGKGFSEDKLQMRASALTYYSMLSVVPVLAMAFGVAKGFGLEENLKKVVLEKGGANQIVWERIFEFVESTLASTQGGLIAGVGMVILMWSVIKLLNVIEMSLNDIWGIDKGRTIARKFTDYLSVFMVGPIIVILSSSVTVYLKTVFNQLAENSDVLSQIGPVVSLLLGLSPYLLIWLLFGLIFSLMPNTRVPFKAALYGAMISGTIFQWWEVAYISTQVGVSRYNAIYGSFAALPLFLIWLQTSWLIVFFGSELAFAKAHLRNYIYERQSRNLSQRFRLKISVLVIYEIYKDYKGAITQRSEEELSEKLHLPIVSVRDALQTLVSAGFLAPIDDDTKAIHRYLPTKDLSKVYLLELIESIQALGNEDGISKDAPVFTQVDTWWDNLFTELRMSPGNKRLSDL